MAKIKIDFLGTNGWFDSETGETLCILIETADEYIVLDAGNAIRKLDRYIKTDKPIFLFISHFHLDHINGLHLLAKFSFKQGLNICIPWGRRQHLNQIISKKFSMPFSQLPLKVKVHELNKHGRLGIFPVLEQALVLRHPVPCFGFRFRIGDKVIAFIPDTGVCQNAYILARQADLVIAECAFKPGQHVAEWPHLNPETAAEIAVRAQAKKLLLVHFDADIYRTIIERKRAAQSARKIFKFTRATIDDQTVVV